VELAHYGALADLEEWHWWHLARQRILPSVLRDVLRTAGKSAPLRILDVGCGTGKMTRLLGEFGTVCGIDMSLEAAQMAVEKGCQRVVVGRADRLPFAAEQFDLVCAMEVVEHAEDDAGLLRECRRMLAPGGRLYVTVPAFQFLWGPADVFAQHYRRYTRASLGRVVESAGFRVERMSYFCSLLFPGVAAIRLARKPFTRLDQMDSEDLLRGFDFYVGPRLLNGALRTVFSWEADLLRAVDLPWGSSLLALAVKD
jgi:SAM-dependent methyltransferase